MKIRIKTAHGYLSFQPDGRLEYRARAGAWEELDVEGFVLEPDPDLHPPVLPEPPGPPPATTAAYVAAIKAQCEAAGLDLTGPCGAFAITQRVAWGLRAVGIGLVSKPGGNHCQGYSVDYLCFPNGDGVDLLGDAGGRNTPQWAVKPNEFTGQDRWRDPIQP